MAETDPVLLENQIAIMSALVELAHAVGYGTKVSAETITRLRERLQKSEREREARDMIVAYDLKAPSKNLYQTYQSAIEAFWARTRKSGGLD